LNLDANVLKNAFNTSVSQIKTLRVQQNNKTVDTASHQRMLEACTANGRSGNMLKHDKAIVNLSALNWLVKIYMIHDLHYSNVYINGTNKCTVYQFIYTMNSYVFQRTMWPSSGI
jgi:hypothetical protein